MKTLIKITIIICVISFAVPSFDNLSAATTLNVICPLQSHGFQTSYSITVTVTLHLATSPYTVVDVTTASLNISGGLTASFSSVPAGTSNYYISIKGWNVLETWSAVPQSITAGGTSSYDFSTSSSQAYGNNLTPVDGGWGLFQGDLNQDKFINLVDIITVYTDEVTFVTGQVATDINGDGFVDLADLMWVVNNSTIFVATKRP